MTYEQILNMMKDFAASHKQIKCFGYGNISDIEVPVDPNTGLPVQKDYAYMFLNPSNHSITAQMITYRFNVIFMDLASELQPTGFSGLNSVIKAQSDTLLIANDLLAWIEYNTQYDTELVKNSSITPFKERFNDTVAGMTVTLEFQVPNTLNLCDAPIIPDTPIVDGVLIADLYSPADSGAMVNPFGNTQPLAFNDTSRSTFDANYFKWKDSAQYYEMRLAQGTYAFVLSGDFINNDPIMNFVPKGFNDGNYVNVIATAGWVDTEPITTGYTRLNPTLIASDYVWNYNIPGPSTNGQFTRLIVNNLSVNFGFMSTNLNLKIYKTA